MTFLTVTLVLCDDPVCNALGRRWNSRPAEAGVFISLTWSLTWSPTCSPGPGHRAGVTEMRPLRTNFCCRINRTAPGSPPVALLVSGASFQSLLKVFDQEGLLSGSHYILRFRQTCFCCRFRPFGENSAVYGGVRFTAPYGGCWGYGSGLNIDGIRVKAERSAPTDTPTN